MTTIALYNIKGGVGKTAAAVNLAYLAAEAGKKVLVWDLDPQGAASFYFRSEAKPKAGFKKILNQNVEFEENISKTSFDNLYLIPADLANRHLDVVIEDIKQSKKKFKTLISDQKGKYDYLFLDCPPGIGLLSEIIFAAADVVLVPTIPTTLSIRTYEMIRSFFAEHEIKQEKLMCFFNMADVRKTLHNDVIKKYYNHASFLKHYIPYLSVVEKMGVSVAPVPSFAPTSYAAECFRELWRELRSNIG
jgi:chromosome partitioning protein